ncbi:DUF2637 domain-containing protein [Streptomyces sp. Root1310]|uniref:DUF2637 domain-containing protein n=1 Tax=Streptomyces sp. Root1310 TaxID=1736452 RepID=UPI001F5B0A0E|nr:DUF2637 domain-containing protein [Streptomyces sp. Root1310]
MEGVRLTRWLLSPLPTFHMEGVRLTRWLLSPLPTFLLWRRMKLWELRSYEQVIKLEQERLVYQARLRSRFGRAWRRKAPVESLMPLRLARYGVPLAETAPAGLAAAGIQPTQPPLAAAHQLEPESGGPARTGGGPTAGATPVLQQEQAATARTNPDTRAAEHAPQLPPRMRATGHHKPAQASTAAPHPAVPAPHAEPRPPQSSRKDNGEPNRRVTPISPDWSTPPGTEPASAQSTLRSLDHYAIAATPDGARLPDKRPAQPPRTAPAPRPRPRPRPTTVDRYYQVWADFHHRHHRYPDAAELSTHLAEHGILDRSQQPIKPKSLSRYLLQFRLYTAWAPHRATTRTPDLHRITQELTHQGITAQYNRPLRFHHFTPHLRVFERRWQTLNPDDTQEHT